MSVTCSFFQQSYNFLKSLRLDVCLPGTGLHSPFLLEDLPAVIPKNAITSPSPHTTMVITPATKHQVHKRKFIISNLISITSIFASVEYFNAVIRTHFSKSPLN